MAKLVTGGTGYIGSETVRQLVNRGEEVVAMVNQRRTSDTLVNRYRIADIEKKIKIVGGDLGNFSQVLNIVKDNKIDAIYHIGGMLRYESELNPWASFQTNVLGTYHVFEAARLFDVPKIMFTSSAGTFQLGIGDVVDDWTIQRPISFYACGKLYCEGMGRWYSTKFGLAFRSVRYPMVIAPNVRTPGHWAPPMIEDAILGKPHVCHLGMLDFSGPSIYISDAAKAAIDVLDAPREKIQTMNYNVAGTPDATSARDLEALLKKRYPGFQVSYKSEACNPQRPTPKVFSDHYARKEWGWQPEFSTIAAIVEQFEKDLKEHPARYNLKRLFSQTCG